MITAMVVDANDLPTDILNWCVDNDISTHYDNALVIFDSMNPLLEWMAKTYGELTSYKGRFYVGVIAT